MNLSTAHGKKKSKGIGKQVLDKTPRDLGPADTTIHTRLLYNCVETVMWRVDGSMVNILWDGSTDGELTKHKRPYTRRGKRRLPVPFRRLTISFNTFTENTIRKLITGPILVRRDRKIVLDRCDDDQQNCSSSESWHKYGSRGCRCVRAHWNPCIDLPQMLVCSKCQSVCQQGPQHTLIF